jgi:hypothetical protein
VSKGSQLHDRPVSNVWFAECLLGVPVASLRQSAIQQLVRGLGCDGLQLAAYTGLGIQAVQGYLKLFGQPAPDGASAPSQPSRWIGSNVP